MKNTLVKDAAILTAITLVAGVCLAFVYDITKAPIEKAQEQAKQEAYQEVFEEADSFESLDTKHALTILEEGGFADNNTVDEAAVAKDKSGSDLGYVITVTNNQGYGGDIQFSMGIQSDGTVNGIAMLSISETAGLGMNANDPDFRNQYAGKNVDEFQVVKGAASSDGDIDAISGATITSDAVTDGVNAGLCYFKGISEGGTQ